MSQRSAPLGPVTDPLAASLDAHRLRLNELRLFHKTNKIKLSTELKDEFNEIVNSLSSILTSVALLQSAKTVSDSVVDAVKKEFSNLANHITEKPASVVQPHILPDASTSKVPMLPKSYANTVKSSKNVKSRITNPNNVYLNKRNILFVKKGSGSEDVTFSEVNLLLSKDPSIRINKIFVTGIISKSSLTI